MASLAEREGFQETFYDLPDLGKMHVVTAGPDAGAPVVLLHGFPDFWYGWRRQMRALAEAGYRVLAPDQRGYNLTAKPGPYHVETIGADCLRLADAAGYDRFHVVGHDWGGAVAWWLAEHRAERLLSLTALNAPHIAIGVRAALRGNRRQLQRSSYMFFFATPGLSEWLLRRNHHALMRDGLRRSARPGAFSDTDVERYAEAWARPGALSAMLGWYRAFVYRQMRHFWQVPCLARIRVPGLIIWGERDSALGVELADQSRALLETGRLVRLPEATHWVHMEYPEQVNRHLLEHLATATLSYNSH